MADDPEAFPFTTPEGSEARMFIQWKGTDVCLDFHCPCGRSSHFDGYFAYWVQCACGQIYQLGTQVIAKKQDVTDPEFTGSCVQALDPWAMNGEPVDG